MSLQGKRVLLIITGGIAAYKSLELIRRLRERGASVRAVLTQSAIEFVTPLSVAALTGEKALTALFDLTDETEIGHIQLSRDADLLVVAPATADIMAKMAQGHANDLATTALLATDKPVLIAPAMNVRMWEHAATQRNLTQLQADGIHIVGPDDGAMACGEFGPGRMAEPMDILARITALLAPTDRPLVGKHVLITAGPTHEPIDPVRYIANRSSGKQGYALARAAIAAGAQVTLVSGPTALPVPDGLATFVPVETAAAMYEAVHEALPADIAIMTAAVADWRVANQADEKIKKDASGALPTLSFAENPDIAASLGKHASKRPGFMVGFAAETENVEAHARAKLAKKGCDWIVANDVSPETGIMGGDRNQVQIISATGIETLPDMPKDAVAEALIARLAAAIAE